jgi:predicted membrane-bound dolichyl-phosphate-mannose-protein mannosyltransferase
VQTAMWLIPILPFILAIATTWSLREAIAETVWFNVAYVVVLAIIYLADLVGLGFISTSPVGPGGGIALGAGFAALAYRRYQWKQEQRRLAILRAERARREAAARKAAGNRPQEKSLIVDAFRFAGTLERQRRNAKRTRP